MTEQHEQTYADGAPCWADLSTPDITGARRFYSALLGWTIDEPNPAMGGYANARIDGQTVAGMVPSMPGQSMPSAWSVYLKSSDIDATARAISGAGGTLLMQPMTVGEHGRMLVAFDATGAAFGIWQPGQHRGAQRFDQPGAMCWHEVNTRDGAATDTFYRALFPYEQSQVGDGKDFDYVTYTLGDKVVGGRLQMTAAWGDLPAHWLTYFAVTDADAAAARVQELGGKLMHGPFDSPHGRIAVVADPYGAVFSLIAPAANDRG